MRKLLVRVATAAVKIAAQLIQRDLTGKMGMDILLDFDREGLIIQLQTIAEGDVRSTDFHDGDTGQDLAFGTDGNLIHGVLQLPNIVHIGKGRLEGALWTVMHGVHGLSHHEIAGENAIVIERGHCLIQTKTALIEIDILCLAGGFKGFFVILMAERQRFWILLDKLAKGRTFLGIGFQLVLFGVIYGNAESGDIGKFLQNIC